ncbi:hypothetical protein ACFW3D_37690 [Streptomyces sp. NPDC058864]
MTTFASCELEATDLLTERLRNLHFRRRLEDTSATWGLDFPSFTRRVQIIIAIGLFSAHHRRAEAAVADQRQPDWSRFRA